ncbi:hypothetical protein [Variovorax paradoxus]|uniref:PLD phosphodiesterase domain-containing protein n=1 Tax=Variovorax paradoxus (strain EPS) TaxID=595537 RepID=E6V3Y1_VARPE|nr:hypothetical protein [Variovorax paradoxus]ADU38100.1 hypothetical protein Varpa_3927 [Variovorax paradoxus EPS]
MTQDDKSAPVMRHALEHMLDQFVDEKPEWAVFTTFTFVSTFFEANVLPLLGGIAVEDLKGSKLLRADLNDALASVRVVVACDRSAEPQPKGELRYGLLPVGLERGRFHPKITLLGGRLKSGSGKNGIWMSVGSGNLSLSGWALQREVVGVTAVTQQHSDSLRPMIEWLADQARQRLSMAEASGAHAEGSVVEVLDGALRGLLDPASLAPASPTSPTLHLAWPPGLARPDAPPTALLPALMGNRRWEHAAVVSPFWSGVEDLVAALGVKTCMLVPAPSSEGRFHRLADAPIDRCEYGRFSSDSGRTSHAKGVLLSRAREHVLCIGSANFTQAAWMHGAGQLSNVEAVLRYAVTGASPWRSLFQELPPEDMAPPLEPGDPDGEQAPPLPPFEAEAVCDWGATRLKIRVRIHADAHLRGASLSIAEHSSPVDIRKASLQCFDFPAPPARLVTNFDLAYATADGRTFTFTGLVLQVDAPEDVLGYRPKPKLNDVLKFLRSLRPNEDPGKASKRARGGEGAEDDEADNDESAARSIDLFAFFQGTFQLRRYFQKHSELDPCDPTLPFGLGVLHRAVVLQEAPDDESTIARYVQLAELLATLDSLRRHAPPPAYEALRTQVAGQVRTLEAEVLERSSHSELFQRVFSKSQPTERSQMLIEWFRRELQVGDA